jgi:hypothetical protein
MPLVVASLILLELVSCSMQTLQQSLDSISVNSVCSRPEVCVSVAWRRPVELFNVTTNVAAWRQRKVSACRDHADVAGIIVFFVTSTSRQDKANDTLSFWMWNKTAFALLVGNEQFIKSLPSINGPTHF